MTGPRAGALSLAHIGEASCLLPEWIVESGQPRPGRDTGRERDGARDEPAEHRRLAEAFGGGLRITPPRVATDRRQERRPMRIIRAVLTAIGQVITAPFRLIARMFGGGGGRRRRRS